MMKKEAGSREIAGFLDYSAFIRGSVRFNVEGRIELPQPHPNGWKSGGKWWILEFDILVVHFHFLQEESFILRIDEEVDREYLVLSIKNSADGVYHVRCVGRD